jgi:iron complex outermembrane recepter protein
VRTPSRIDRHLFAPATPPYVIAGGPDFESEKLYAFELGYKVHPSSRLNGSIAGFYNIYDELRSVELGPPAVLANKLEGEAWGIETELSGQLFQWWRLNAGYTFFNLELHRKPGSTDTAQERQEGDSPHHQFFFKSRMDLLENLEFDATVRYVDELPNQRVPEYVAFDLRLGWRPLKRLEISVAALNLFDPQHPEFGTPTNRREIDRSVYAKLTWQF